MKFGIDEYAHLNSALHRWDPRFKLVGLVSLIFAFSFVQDLRMLPPMLLVTGLVFAVSRLPLLFLLSRLRYPSFFILAVVLFLPFLSGETVIASIGPFDLRQEGLAGALLIGTRVLSILTIGLIIFGTSSLLTALKAMRALGLPSVIADMALLAYRYLYEIGDYSHRMETAMRLRYFRGRRLGPRGLRTLAWLGGSILVRSYERSEWVYKAMITRGYGHGTLPRDDFRANSADVLALGCSLLIAAGFVVGDVLM